MNTEEFQELVKRHPTLINFWDECPDSLRMLGLLLSYHNYCRPERVDRYTNWLRIWIKDNRAEEEAAFDLREFEPHTGHIKEIENSVEEGSTTYDDANRMNLINSLVIALSKTKRALDIKEADAAVEYFNTRFAAGYRGDAAKIPELELGAVRIQFLKEQADKLREFVGNPFFQA